MSIFNRFFAKSALLSLCLLTAGGLSAQFTISATGGAPSDPFTDDGRILVDLIGTSQGPYTVRLNGMLLPGTRATEPFVISDLAAGTYTLEVSGADNGAVLAGIVVDDPCFTTYDPVTCDDDPSGYIYCSGTGEIITGATINVTAANGSPVIITADGSDGYYKFLVNPDLADTYTITYTLPGTFTDDPSRLSATPYEVTDNFPRNELGGADATNNGQLDNFALRMSDPNFNMFFAQIVYDGNAGEGTVTLNNIPLLCEVEIEAEGKATCDPAMDMSNTATEGQYFVQIDTVSLDNGGVVTVEIDGEEQTYDTEDPNQAPLLFGPYDNSATGGDFKTANLTSDDGQSTGILEIPEVICGLEPLDANGDPSLNGSGYFCTPTNDPADVPTGVIVAQAQPGTFLSGGTSGRQQQYVLLDTDSMIVAVNMTGIFRDLTSDDYIVYAINYRTDETGEVAANLNVGDDFTEFTAAERGETSVVDGNCFILCGPVNITVEPCVSIGSTVFTDNNNDGVLNMTDAGIDMVEVVLTYYDENGVPFRTDTTETNADGSYFFGGLPEGDYTVHLTAENFAAGGPLENSPLSSLLPAGEMDDDVDNNDNGIQEEAGDSIVSPLITLMGGTEPTDDGTETGQNADQDNNPDDADEDANGNMTVDFGLVPNLSIGSFVYVDNNNDGLYDQGIDAADMGLADVNVILLREDENGDFVEVNVGPDGMLGTADDAPGGVVTAADGSYLFSNLPAGNYQVQLPADNFVAGGAAEMFPLSSTPTVGADAGANNVDDDDNGIQDGGLGTVITSPTIALSAGDEPGAGAETGIGGDQDNDGNATFVDTNGDMTIDFGLTPPMSIGSTVFFDMNADGVQDPTPNGQEFGIEGVTVQLFQDVDMDGALTGDELTPVATTVTNANGEYLFDSIPPGVYQVTLPMAPAAAPMNTEGAGQVLTDTGDTGGDDLADVGTQVADPNDATNPFGPVSSPFITLLPGTEPEGAEENALAGGDQDDAGGLLIDANGDMTVDFGFVPMLSVGSTVFNDTDGNSMQNGPGETGIQGATVNLYFDGNMDGVIDATELMNPIATTTTGANGEYLFQMLSPGMYQVGVVSDATLGTDTPSPMASPADDDIDGTNDGTNTMLDGGMFVSLSSIFELATGTEPVDGMGEDGTNNMLDPGNDEDGNMTIDFGFVPMNSVGSTVFYDQNDDGVQAEPGTDQAIYEAGIPGIKVVLLQQVPDPADGTMFITVRVDSTTTDDDGNYFFGMLPNGTFQVEIPDFPVGAPTSSTGQDTGDAVDGNDNGDQPGGIGTVTTSAPFELMSGTEPVNGAGGETEQGADQDDPINGGVDANGNMTIDFGFIPNLSIGSQVFYDADGDGVQNPADPRETGIAGAIVTLLVEDPANPGTFLPAPGVAPQTTGDDGLYFFDMLSPGNYQVQVTPSPNAPDATGTAADPNGNTDGTTVGTQGPRLNGNPGLVTSGTIMLTPGAYNNLMEPRPGGDQDDGAFADVNGTAVVDFSFAPVYDLALRKTFVPGGVPAVAGATLDFDVTVFNQGVTRVFDVDVIDYDIPGVTFVSATGPTGGNTIEGTPVMITDNGDGTFQIDSLNGNDSVTVRVQLMIDDPFTGTFPIINEAEITQFDNDEDGANDFPTDVDSTPDDTQGNDPGNEPGSGSDDAINGDGLNGGGAPGDEDPTTDEDDSDVAIVEFLDLALTKELDITTLANGQATENDEITFDILVLNQGNVTVTNVDVIDYIPCGLDFVPAADGTTVWTMATDANGMDAVTTTVPGPILPGAGAAITITFRIKTTLEIRGNDMAMPPVVGDCPAGTTDPYINRAEITGQDDEDGVEIPNTQDVDSTPNDDPTDDAGGAVNTNSDNAVAGDGTGAPGDADPATDEDDADPGNLMVFDVALNKVIDETFAAAPFIFGSTVKFDISVFSQGNVPVSRIAVVDYLPAGLELDATNPLNAGWAADGTTADGRTIIARDLTTADFPGGDPLGFGDMATVSVYLTVVPANPFTDEAYTNTAEIEEADGEINDGAGNFATTTFNQDADSNFDRDPTNNGGNNADTEGVDDPNDSDDSVNGDGTGAPGDNSAATDQDNADPAFVDVAAQSLGSTVFVDNNNNGMLDVGTDEGIPMVPVILLQEGDDGVFREVNVGPDGLLGTADDAPGGTLTDADGNYFFGQLPPGNYQVQIPADAFAMSLMDTPVSSNATTSGFTEQDPDGPTDAPEDDVDNDDNGLQPGGSGNQVTSGTISLVPNMEPENEAGQGGDQDVAISDINGNMTLDFGFFAPVTVTGDVFVDVNGDGVQDGDDVPLPGATVTLINADTGEPVDTDADGNVAPANGITVVDASGNYSFDNLPPGNYSVVVDNSTSDNAALYDFTTPNVGDDDDIDSDVTPAAAISDTATSDNTGFIASGDTSDVLDAGLVCAITVEVADPFTICSTATVDLTDGAAVNPASLLGGTWTTDGTGEFLDENGNVLAPPYRLGVAVSYVPSSADALRGNVTLTLTSDDPGELFPASVCEPVSNSVEITILKVDCGQFFWDGQ